MKSFNDWLSEATSGELLKPKRGKVMSFDYKKYPELAVEFFELIQTAYAEIGGHSKILTPEDVFKDPDWNWWAGEDVHGSPDFDLIFFGKKTKFGVKHAGIGHDGSKTAKKEYLDQRGKDLKELGYYIEVSGKLSEILMNKYNVPVVTDQEIVEKVLGKKVDWHGQNPEDPNATGNAWYGRTIAGHNHNKIMLGRPKV